MLTTEEAKALGRRLDEMERSNPAAGYGLFIFVFKKEPAEEAARYESHLREREFCRIALHVYRYKRDVAEALGREAGGDKV